MYSKDVGLREQPFHQSGRPAAFVQYKSQHEALTFLKSVLSDDRGVGLLYGPEASGKSTLVDHFVESLPADLAVAVVDGTRLKTTQLLSKILGQFGYELGLGSADELLNMLNVFAVQQTRTYQPPLLILENLHNMYPSALLALCKLAALTMHKRFALRIILVSNRPVRPILQSPGMNCIADRLVGAFELGPLTANETLHYLYTKLKVCGVNQPDHIFPVDVCDELHIASAGWPGILDGIAMCTIDRADRFPVRHRDIDHPAIRNTSDNFEGSDGVASSTDSEAPKLIVTRTGKTLQEFKMTDSKVLVGRSELSDVFINHQYVSKHHALLVRDRNALLLVDLKSTNGTFVNSRRVRSTVLRHDDIVSLGNHAIKVDHPSNRARVDIGQSDIADTAYMKSITDVRRLAATKNLHLADIGKKKA